MVPILLVTGFLGSGKTTLLNRLLTLRGQNNSQDQIALIVNEFGDVGIDADLLPEGVTKQVELPGGCICCQLDEDLKKTILELLNKRSDLSSIIIETTGVAEPLPISWTLTDDDLAAVVRLSAVLTLVDAVNHARHRAVSPAVDAQVDYADLLVVSKGEQLALAERTVFEAALRHTNQHAPIIWRSAENDVRLWTTLTDPSLQPHRTPEKPRGHSHRDEFDSVSLTIKNVLDFEEFSEQLESLPPNYLRIKGIALVVDRSTGSEEPFWIAFHRVGARVSAEPTRQGEARMVALGTELDRHALLTCVAKSVLD